MADVLVTGATGLLGFKLICLLAEKHDVTAIARKPPTGTGTGTRTGTAAAANVRWLVHDLARPMLPADLPARVDVVVHLAQSRRFREFPTGAPDIFAVNVAATAALLDWAVAAGASQFILASTGGVYGPSREPHHEDEPPAASPPSFYAASKRAAEVLTTSYCSQFSVCVLRPFFIYGPGQDPGMLVPRLVERVRSGGTITLDGLDGMRFNPIHVSDAAAAVVAAIDHQSSSVVNIAGPEVISLRHAVSLIGACMGRPPHIESRTDVEPVDVVGDTSRMTALLGAPRIRLADVLVELCR